MRHFYLFLLIVSGIVLSGTRMIAQSRPSVGSIRVVSGTIVDENNKAMANIVIYIKGTDIRVISDTDGYFSLPLKDTKDHVLITNSYNTGLGNPRYSRGRRELRGGYPVILQATRTTRGRYRRGRNHRVITPTSLIRLSRMDIPVMEIPGTVGVATRKLLEDQQATTMTEAIRNLGGVKGGPSGEASNINEVFSSRGFSMTNSRNYFRNGVRYLKFSNDALSSIERIEILKGPASVLYGAVEPGGIITLSPSRAYYTPRMAQRSDTALRL